MASESQWSMKPMLCSHFLLAHDLFQPCLEEVVLLLLPPPPSHVFAALCHPRSSPPQRAAHHSMQTCICVLVWYFHTELAQHTRDGVTDHWMSHLSQSSPACQHMLIRCRHNADALCSQVVSSHVRDMAKLGSTGLNCGHFQSIEFLLDVIDNHDAQQPVQRL